MDFVISIIGILLFFAITPWIVGAFMKYVGWVLDKFI